MRADAYDHGEGTSGTAVIGLDEFQGFHRIENLLFRDEVTAPAVPYAEGLLTLWDHLEEALAMPANFDFCGCGYHAHILFSCCACMCVSYEQQLFRG